jgi:hypothetical protein
MGAIRIKGTKIIAESNEKWYLHYFEKPPLGSKHGKLNQKVHFPKILF